MSYAHRIDDGQPIKLKDYNSEEDGGLNREEAQALTARLTGELAELQELLYAASRQSVLVVLQGRDTSGKDGAISGVFGPLNSLGCSVASFKQPTEAELAHDFLWRVHAHTPARGQITVFNRSHYEDVLVVRVHELAPPEVWRQRYDHINHFEQLLTDSHTIVRKFYLHISKDEQEKRLRKREEDPAKAWKLSVGDWKEREYWNAYTDAYEDAINKCRGAAAPWYIVPADKKWFRNLAIAEAMVETLRPYRDGWIETLRERGQKELALIEEFRRGGRKG